MAGVPHHVVGVGGLLDPAHVELGELFDRVDGVGDAPALVGVDGYGGVGPGCVAGDLEPPPVVVEIGADLELDGGEAIGDSLAAQPVQLLVAVAQPAGRRGVRGQSVTAQIGDAAAAQASALLKDLAGPCGVQEVAQVGPVDQRHRLRRLQVSQGGPQGAPLPLAAKVPDCVHHRTHGHVHDALVGPQPAQLAVPVELAVDGAGILQQPVEAAAHEAVGGCGHRGGLYVVAPPDREHEAAASQVGLRCGQLEIGG